MQQLFQDSRFVTQNTNLAACLGALRVPLKNVENPRDGKTYADYIRRIEDAETGKVTVYWCFEDRGEEYVARELEGHWAHRERFEEENQDHPLIPMRKALEKLEYITKLWWGNTKLKDLGRQAQYFTDDSAFAACLNALGFEIVSFDIVNKVFGFDQIPSELKEHFDNYREGKHQIATMRLAIEARKLLIAELKRPDLTTQVHYKIGDPLNGGKEMFVTKGEVSEEQLNQLFEKFYE